MAIHCSPCRSDRSTRPAGSSARLFDVARTDAVYSEPLTQGDTTVIVASGSCPWGWASALAAAKAAIRTMAAAAVAVVAGAAVTPWGRPVAVISVDVHGVQVQPVFDLTKVAIAALTAFGAVCYCPGGACARRQQNGRRLILSKAAAYLSGCPAGAPDDCAPHLPPTPLHHYPQLDTLLGASVFVKHEKLSAHRRFQGARRHQLHGPPGPRRSASAA